MIKVSDIKIKPGYTEEDLKIKISKELKINKNEILEIEYIKKSIDARRKPNVFYNLTLAVGLKNEQRFSDRKIELDYSLLTYGKKSLNDRPVVVGFGPAGMFCSLALARMGLNQLL